MRSSLNVWNPRNNFKTIFAYTEIGNILPDTTAAPAIQAQQKELDKHMRMDSLEQKLQNRPKPEELVKGGIISADESPVQD